VFEIVTDPAVFSEVRENLEKAGYSFVSAEIEMLPQNTVAANEELVEKINRLLDMLEDNDDVQNVYHNADMD
jgi:transcriptional/translational regulatory protein YebC/TACO1